MKWEKQNKTDCTKITTKHKKHKRDRIKDHQKPLQDVSVWTEKLHTIFFFVCKFPFAVFKFNIVKYGFLSAAQSPGYS